MRIRLDKSKDAAFLLFCALLIGIISVTQSITAASMISSSSLLVAALVGIINELHKQQQITREKR